MNCAGTLQVSTIVDPVNDPIGRGLANYAVSDELYHPLVYEPERSTIFATAFDRVRCPPPPPPIATPDPPLPLHTAGHDAPVSLLPCCGLKPACVRAIQ
jgi:hypothetical protein